MADQAFVRKESVSGRLPGLLLSIAGVVTSLVVLILVVYAPPRADDFCLAKLEPIQKVAGWERASNIWEYSVGFYFKWSGRRLSGLIETLLMRGGTINMYALALTVSLLLEFWGLVYFLRFLFPEAGVRFALILGGVFSMLVWAMMPVPGDSIFWIPGHIETISSPVLMMVLIVWLCGNDIGPGRGLAIALMAFAVPVMHEITGIVLIAMGILAVRRAYAQGSANRHWWATAVAMAVASFCISSASPGNSLRMAIENPDGMQHLALAGAGRQIRAWWPGTLLHPGLWAATLVFVLESRIVSYRPAWVEQYLGGIWKWVSLAVFSVTMVFVFVMPVLLRASDLSARTITQIHILFLLGWFFHIFVFTRDLAAEPLGTRWAVTLRGVAVTILAGVCLLTGNTMTAYGDIFHRVRPWSAAMAARDQFLWASAPGDAVVAPVPRRPFLYFASEIEEDPTHWRNLCIASYYGVKSVRAERDKDSN